MKPKPGLTIMTKLYCHIRVQAKRFDGRTLNAGKQPLAIRTLSQMEVVKR